MFALPKRQVAKDDGLADGVSKVRAGCVSKYFALSHDGLGPIDRDILFQSENTQHAPITLHHNFLKRSPPDEVALGFQVYPEPEARFVGVVVRRDVTAPIQVALLHS